MKPTTTKARTAWLVLSAEVIFIASSAAVSGIGFALDLTDRYDSLLENVANPSDAQIASTCGTNQDCREGLKRDAASLRDALDMFEESKSAYRDAQSQQAEMLKPLSE